MNNFRSLLFVPAENKRLCKIGLTNADAYIIDLEDSIGEEFKDEALACTVEFLRTNNCKNLFIRINKHRCEKELKVLGEFHIGFVLPKFHASNDYFDFLELIRDHNVIALIESPKGIMNAYDIASIPWVDALAFGAEDFTIASGMKNSYNNLFVVKNMLALSAKANEKKVYDTPCFQLADDSILDAEIQQAMNLGFNGKLAIHPKQINRINDTFGSCDVKYMKHIIEVFEQGGASVCEIDGVVYERLHINKMKEKIGNNGLFSC